MNPKKIWLIAKREYIQNFRRKTFLFTAFGMPILMVVIMVVVIGLMQRTIDDTSGYQRVGVIDRAQIITDQDGALVVELPSPFELFADEAEAAAELQTGTIDGYYVIPANFMAATSPGVEAYYRQTLALNDGLRDKLHEVIKQVLASQIGNPTLAMRLEAPLREMEIFKLGNPQPLEESALVAAFFVPAILGILIFILTMTTSQFLMSGLVEEKENRMMELFVTSARPSEMLWGKLLGLGTLGLTQIVVWAVMGLGYALFSGTLDIGQALANLQLTPSYLLLVLAYTILGYMIFGALMAGIGATVNAEQEGRQLASILSMFGIAPLVVMFVFLSEPNGTVAVALSLFPFTAPVSMILRLSFATVPPLQVALSLGIMALSVVAVMQIAARIFRLGMLNYGKRPGLRAIWRAIVAGRKAAVLTSAAHSQEVAS